VLSAPASVINSVATHTITAIYGGDSGFTGSTSTTFLQTITQANTTTTVTSSANPSNVGNAVTFTATVGGGIGMTGTATFSDGEHF